MTASIEISDDAIPMEVSLCPLGCPGGDDVLFTGRERMHYLPGLFTVVRCRTCGLMRTDPRPTPDGMALFYPPDYGPYQSTTLTAAPVVRRPKPWYKKLFRAVFQFNVDRLPVLQPGKMLEFGCSTGTFMNQMANEGWDVEGIEYSAEAAQTARALGFNVFTGTLESAPNPEHQYDIVVGWMVLEHLHDPVSALKKLQSWTRPGGWLIVSIPNAGALEFKLFKDAWCALELPRHLYHYTPDSLEKLLARGGWRMDRVLYQRIMTDSLASLGNRLADRGFPTFLTRPLTNLFVKPGYKHYALLPLATLLAAFGQVGRMTVWAQKSDD